MKDLTNKKRLYPPIWQHDYHVLRRLRKAIEMLALRVTPTGIIVDYGCGTRPYRQFFLEAAVYKGIDIGGNPHADLIVAPEKRIPLATGYADVVLSTQVLEHVDDVGLYLSEVSRLLKKGGSFIVSTHGVWPYHPFPIDCHRWTRMGLVKEVERHGMKVSQVTGVLGPFALLTQNTLLVIAGYIGRNQFGRVALAALSVIGNCVIWMEDRLFPPTEKTDAALYIIWAKKQ